MALAQSVRFPSHVGHEMRTAEGRAIEHASCRGQQEHRAPGLSVNSCSSDSSTLDIPTTLSSEVAARHTELARRLGLTAPSLSRYHRGLAPWGLCDAYALFLVMADSSSALMLAGALARRGEALCLLAGNTAQETGSWRTKSSRGMAHGCGPLCRALARLLFRAPTGRASRCVARGLTCGATRPRSPRGPLTLSRSLPTR